MAAGPEQTPQGISRSFPEYVNCLSKGRDIEGTRLKILAAARTEFGAKGLAGARTAEIARKAAVNKRMLHYCFGSKRELYQAVLQETIADYAGPAKSMPDDVAGTLLYWYKLFGNDPESMRLLEWEALQVGEDKVVAEKERRELYDSILAELHRWQAVGRLPRFLNVRQLYLAMIGLAIFPQAFPQLSRLMTGFAPADPRFRRRHADFLRWLGNCISTPDANLATEASRDGQAPGRGGKSQVVERAFQAEPAQREPSDSEVTAFDHGRCKEK